MAEQAPQACSTRDYGRSGVVYSGPVYREHAVEGGKVRVKFDHTGSGLASRDGQPLTWWEIAGADGTCGGAGRHRRQ